MSHKKIAALLLTLALALSAGIGVSAAANHELPYAPEASENDADASAQDNNSIIINRDAAPAYFGADKSQDGKVVIMLDPGHGGMDSGAVNSSVKLYESDINLKIALACRDRLQKYGGNSVYLTHTGVKKSTKLSLDDRVILAGKVKADIFISLHINSDDAGTAKGAEVYVPVTKHDTRYNQTCSALAKKMLANFQSLGLTSRGVRTRKSGNHKYTFDDGTTETADYYYVIREPISRLGIPGMLVEHAFIEGDASFLRVDANLVSLGVADADAIASQYGFVLLPGNPTDASGRYKDLAVTVQPSDVTVKAGQPIKASVTAKGTGLTYQWYYKKSGASSW